MKYQVTKYNETANYPRVETFDNREGYSFKIQTNLCILHGRHMDNPELQNTWRILNVLV